MADFGERAAIAAISYIFAHRYNLCSLFPIVLSGLRGR